MISVVIPVLNESPTVASVVEFAWRDPRVTEVLVVDDGSIDGTPELAEQAGAKVITSTMLGKGASMEDGMRAASNEVVLYLDGDLSGLCADLIRRMSEPVLEGWADFAKAKFSRSAGRVTTLTARPLLKTFFPELNAFEQPLSGIICVRRSLLERLQFESDYGVDIGLLIDAAVAGVPLAEVDIGHIEHDSQPLEVLADMASQVVRVLLGRAAKYGRLRAAQLREVEEVQRRMEAEFSVVLQKVGKTERLALFDMDGVLLAGRYVVELAKRTGHERELAQLLDHAGLSADERTRRIGALFAGVPREIFEQTAKEIPLCPGAREAVLGLRKAGFRVGIVTDSYYVASTVVARRVFADFSIAHLMKFRRGVATGRMALSSAMVHPAGCPCHPRCKRNAMLQLTERMGIGPQHVVAVGDSDNDVCLLEAVGTSFAFQPKTAQVRRAAQHVIEDDLASMLEIVARQATPPDRPPASRAFSVRPRSWGLGAIPFFALPGPCEDERGNRRD